MTSCKLAKICSMLWALLTPTLVCAQEGVIAVSRAQEYAWGQKALRDFLDSHAQTADGNLAVHVDEVGQVVAQVSERPDLSYRFLVVKGKEAQAFAFPGGTVCVTEALTRLCSSDDELAFVLGHEISHIALRHHVSQLRMQELLRRGMSGERALLQTIKSTLDRDSDFEADRYGALYAYLCGHRFTKAHEVLEKLSRMKGKTQQDDSHATFSERREALQAFARELELSRHAFERGVDALNSGAYDEAVEALNLFVAQFPDSVSGRVNLGAAHLARVRSRSGTPHGLSEFMPILAEIDVPEVRGYVDLLELKQARSNFDRTLLVHPDNVPALTGLALVHVRLDELDRARELLAHALSLEPMNPEPILAMGNVQYLAEDYSAALASYSRALSLAENVAAVRRNRALTLEKLGRIEEARGEWQKVAMNEKYRPDARRHLRDLSSD